MGERDALKAIEQLRLRVLRLYAKTPWALLTHEELFTDPAEKLAVMIEDFTLIRDMVCDCAKQAKKQHAIAMKAEEHAHALAEEEWSCSPEGRAQLALIDAGRGRAKDVFSPYPLPKWVTRRQRR